MGSPLLLPEPAIDPVARRSRQPARDASGRGPREAAAADRLAVESSNARTGHWRSEPSLRLRVDRFGRVLDYTLLTSTGYADLDAGINQMMRGAQLPPFPAGMTASQIEVSVRIRFNLRR